MTPILRNWKEILTIQFYTDLKINNEKKLHLKCLNIAAEFKSTVEGINDLHASIL